MDALGLLHEVSRRDSVGGRIVDTLKTVNMIIGPEAELLEASLLEALQGASMNAAGPCRHILEAGGKRIRPLLCMLAFRAARGIGPLPLDLAVTCELLHNATLLHDDVVDEGEVRRGRPAARVVFGNAVAVLGGDYLLVKTVEMVSKRGVEFMAPYSQTLKNLVEGELAQLKRRGSIETKESDYYGIIEGKTASLFRWAAMSGVLAAGGSIELQNALGQYAWNVGIAFQLMDDVLDFTADSSQLGKNILTDISEGKITLPVILAADRSPEIQPLLEQLLKGDDVAFVGPRISELVSSTGAARETCERAAKHTEDGIGAIAKMTSDLNTSVLTVLEDLANALLKREF
jgi:octaprenyl-diphosphate synthase